jgi:hypothetical protein
VRREERGDQNGKASCVGRAKVALIARSVPGVREVRNEVAVAEQVPMAKPGAPMTSAVPATSDASAPIAVVAC